jgi:indole-3-glycerol phosphate synthase
MTTPPTEQNAITQIKDPMHILERICRLKAEEVAARKQRISIAKIESVSGYSVPRRSLTKALSAKARTLDGIPAIIAEHKRKSPSEGPIAPDSDVANVVRAYAEAGASAISVLTDSNFGGSLEDLAHARAASSLAMLRKDFIIDSYQLHESRALGADAVLLIVACLDDSKLKRLVRQAQALELQVLVEVHTEEELLRVPDSADLLGINSRDLSDFSVDLQRARQLAEKAKAMNSSRLLIAESGIQDPSVIPDLVRSGFDAFLIGTHFMQSPNPGESCRTFLQAAGTLLAAADDIKQLKRNRPKPRIKSNRIKPDQIKPDQIKPDRIKPDQIKPDEI